MSPVRGRFGAPRPRTRTVAAVAVGLVLTGTGIVVSLTAVAAAGRPLLVPLLLNLDFACFAVVGSLIALARPGNLVGWLLLAGGALTSFGGAGVDRALLGIVYAPGTVPAASAWAVLGAVLRVWGWSIATVGVPMVFPDGRLAGRRWRWLPGLLGVAIVCQTIGTAFGAHAQLDALADWQNPLSSPTAEAIAEPLSGLALVLTAAAASGAVAELVVRWRRGTSRLRQQIALLAAAALLALLAAPLSVAGVGSDWLFAVTLLPLPIAVGFAVLARGLYDLSTAANKTLVWVLLSATVVAVYALVIAGVGALLDVRDRRWLPWLAAAVVALCLAPLRDLLQRGVNRLIYGRWDDPYALLAGLGRQLEASADEDRLLDEVVDELGPALSLTRVAVRDAAGRVVAGAEPAGGDNGGGDNDTTVRLVAFHQPVGTLRYAATTPLRPEDQRVLDDLARQIGVVLHARRLTGELQLARERLVLAREEERRRLRRDLHDGIGPALAGHVVRLDLGVRRLPPDSPARPTLQTLQRELQGTIADLRRVVEGLRPPALDELGLDQALRQIVDRLVFGSPLSMRLELEIPPDLPAAVEVAIYRIVSEAVSNVVRHARATGCTVRIGGGDHAVTMSVEDDGIGVGASARGAGHGLDTIRERAEELGGEVRFESVDGTSVWASIPLQGSEE